MARTSQTRRKPGRSAHTAKSLDIEAGEALIRMYRQGLGDCFLVRLPGEAGKVFKIMIDCGVILGTYEAETWMANVVTDIIMETSGEIDLLVVTHEHWDHVSGFQQAQKLFAPAGEGVPGKLSVKQIWFAWTENPDDPAARALQGGLKALLDKVRSKAVAFSADGKNGAFAQQLDALLSFHGETLQEAAGLAAAGKGAKTRDALAIAAGLGPVQYREPGEGPLKLRGCPGVNVYVLGPPRAPDMLNKTEPRAEGYHFAGSLFGLTEGTEDGPADSPFDPSLGWPLTDLRKTVSPEDDQLTRTMKEFFTNRYFQDKVPERYRTRDPKAGPVEAPAGRAPGVIEGDVLVDQSWRRIGSSELDEVAEFALQLDGATNNTSLVLAIELGLGGPVLLFVGDAQAGNWLSWDSLPPWKVGNRMVTVADLLARTVFYKVGHHGSHNATLKGRGLERMTRRDLVAFVPVDRAMARKKGWKRMPLPSIIDELMRRTQKRTVVSERELPAGEDVLPYQAGWSDLKATEL